MTYIWQWIQKYKEIISYLFWGGMTTLVSWGTYCIFMLFFQNMEYKIGLLHIEMPANVALANLLSWICAVVFAFVTNKLWVFHSKSWERSVFLPELWKFVSARLVTGVLEICLVPLLVGVGIDYTMFGIDGIAAKFLVSVLVVILNYIFSKMFIFKAKTENK